MPDDTEKEAHMSRFRIMSVAVSAVALLMASCNQPQFSQVQSTDEQDPEEIRVNTLGPDIRIDEGARDVTIWANISANDDSGVSVQGIQEGDSITIENIAGIGWFSDQSGLEIFLSTVHTLSDVVKAAAPAGSVVSSIADQTKAFTTQGEEKDVDAGGKPRDGYGKDMDGDFATDEGGIVVCMPSAHGPMYANDDNHLDSDAQSEGRLEKHVSTEMNGRCFFPARVDDGTMGKSAKEPGALYILAFDSEYGDNAGSYQVKVRIIRSRP